MRASRKKENKQLTTATDDNNNVAISKQQWTNESSRWNYKLRTRVEEHPYRCDKSTTARTYQSSATRYKKYLTQTRARSRRCASLQNLPTQQCVMALGIHFIASLYWMPTTTGCSCTINHTNSVYLFYFYFSPCRPSIIYILNLVSHNFFSFCLKNKWFWFFIIARYCYFIVIYTSGTFTTCLTTWLMMV